MTHEQIQELRRLMSEADLKSWTAAAPGAVLPAAIVALANHADEMLDALESHTWRDISTAPKDGTPVLGVGKLGFPYVVWWTLWDDHSGAVWVGQWVDSHHTIHNPKFWIPLPLPPKE